MLGCFCLFFFVLFWYFLVWLFVTVVLGFDFLSGVEVLWPPDGISVLRCHAGFWFFRVGLGAFRKHFNKKSAVVCYTSIALQMYFRYTCITQCVDPFFPFFNLPCTNGDLPGRHEPAALFSLSFLQRFPSLLLHPSFASQSSKIHPAH